MSLSSLHLSSGIHGLRGPRFSHGALFYMLLCVLLFSGVPLLIAYTAPAGRELLVNAGWRLGMCVCLGLFLLVFGRSVVFSRAGVRSLRAGFFTRPMALSLGVAFSYVLFMLSLRWVDVAVAVVLTEAWPLGMVAYLAWRYRHSELYRKNLRWVFPLLGLAFVGFILVAASDAGGFAVGQRGWLELLLGLSCLTLAAACGGFGAAATIEWGRLFAARYVVERRRAGEGWPSLGGSLVQPAPVLVGIVLAIWSAMFLGLVLSLAGSVLVGESFSLRAFCLGVLGGLLLQGPAAVFLRQAGLLSSNLGVNAWLYFIPVFSLGFLAVFGLVGVAQPPWLLAGVSVVLVANLSVALESAGLLRWRCGVLFLLAVGLWLALGPAWSVGLAWPVLALLALGLALGLVLWAGPGFHFGATPEAYSSGAAVAPVSSGTVAATGVASSVDASAAAAAESPEVAPSAVAAVA